MNNIIKHSDNHKAEQSLLSELKLLGYFHIKCQHYRSSDDILFEADGKLRDILVRARVCVADEDTFSFSTTEKRQLKRKAEKVNREPWIAVLKFDDKDGKVSHIHWDTV